MGHRAGDALLAGDGGDFREAEVSQLDPPVEDVSGLHVPVHHAMLRGLAQRPRDGPEVGPHLVGAEAALEADPV